MTTDPSTPSEFTPRTWAIGQVCEHDTLGRKCDICLRDDEIAFLRADLAAIKSANDRTHHACVDAAKSYPGIHGESFSPTEAIAWYEEQLARKDKVIAVLKESRRAWMEWDGGSTRGSLNAATQSDAALRELGVDI